MSKELMDRVYPEGAKIRRGISGRQWHYILEDDGTARECSPNEWSAFRVKYGTCHVGLTHFDPVGSVSTVFMGLNHALPGEPPAIFETYVGTGQGEGGDVVERYSTYQDAKDGHKKWVQATAQKLGQTKRIEEEQLYPPLPWLSRGLMLPGLPQ